MREAKGRIEGTFFFALSATSGTKSNAVRLQFANNPSFTSAVTIFEPNVAASNANLVNSIVGYFVGNNIIFPSNSIASMYGAFASAYTIYPFSGDLFYRVGFNPFVVGQTCSLSGAHISIVP